MIEKLNQLPPKQRMSLSVGAIVLVVVFSYTLITRSSVNRLRVAMADYDVSQSQQEGMADWEITLARAERSHREALATLNGHQHRCFAPAQVTAFWENVTLWAIDHQLHPVSRMTSRKERLTVPDLDRSLTIESLKVVFQGHVHQLIAYLTTLVERPQRVWIRDLQLSLVPGETHLPQASFEIVLICDDQLEGTSP